METSAYIFMYRKMAKDGAGGKMWILSTAIIMLANISLKVSISLTDFNWQNPEWVIKKNN